MPAATPKATLYGALAALQAELPMVKRDAMGQVGPRQYRYADLTSVWNAIQPLLAKHGLIYVVTPSQAPEGTTYEVRGHLIHVATGDSVTGAVPLTGGSAPQQIGAAITYARRYLLACLTGLLTDDDPDAHGTNESAPSALQGTVPGDEQQELGEARTRAHNAFTALTGNGDLDAFFASYAEWSGTGQDASTASAGDLHRYADEITARQ